MATDRPRRERKPSPPFFQVKPPRAAELAAVIEHEEPERLDALARHFGGKWAASRHLSTVHLRPVAARLARLRRPDTNLEASGAELTALRPLICYQAARQPPWARRDLEEYGQVLLAALDTAGTDAVRFRRFLALFDALLAYFRAGGGL